jgi:hypothetical protein
VKKPGRGFRAGQAAGLLAITLRGKALTTPQAIEAAYRSATRSFGEEGCRVIEEARVVRRSHQVMAGKAYVLELPVV